MDTLELAAVTQIIDTSNSFNVSICQNHILGTIDFIIEGFAVSTLPNAPTVQRSVETIHDLMFSVAQIKDLFSPNLKHHIIHTL